MSLTNFDQIEMDKRQSRVMVGAGVTYSRLVDELYKGKMALESVPSCSNILVVDSIFSGCHGGGPSVQTSANYVEQIEFVNFEGQICTLSKGD